MRSIVLILSVVALAPLAALIPGHAAAQDSKNITTLPQYEGIVEPVLDMGETTLFAITMGKPTLGAAGPGYLLVESWRVTALSYFGYLANELPPWGNDRK